MCDLEYFAKFCIFWSLRELNLVLTPFALLFSRSCVGESSRVWMAKTMSLPRGQTPYDRDRAGTSTGRAGSREVSFSDIPEGHDRYFRPKPQVKSSDHPQHPPLTGVLGGWSETKRLFPSVPEDESVVRPSYFRSFERELERRGVPPPRYDDDRMESRFRHLEYATVPSRCALDLEHVRAAFCIPPEYEIRLPGSDDVPFKPRSGGYIALPLAHLRLGLRFPLHRFVYHMFRKYLCCALYQLAPNALWSMLCFIVRCAELGVSPSPRLFWSLFQASGNGSRPIFSFTWRDKKFGERWAELDSSHRMWHFEWIWIRGGDLAWLPLFSEDIHIDLPHTDYEEKVLTSIQRFTRVHQGNKWKPRLFRDNTFLCYYNREYLVCLV